MYAGPLKEMPGPGTDSKQTNKMFSNLNPAFVYAFKIQILGKAQKRYISIIDDIRFRSSLKPARTFQNFSGLGTRNLLNARGYISQKWA